MRLLGQLLLACLVIAALQGILAVLAVGVVLLLLWGIIAHAETTIPLLLFLFLLEGFARFPLVTVVSLLGLGGALLIASRAKRARGDARRPPILLPGPGRDADGDSGR